jgi:hypothetical protein
VNRAEHLAWAKQRALEELERSGSRDAVASMLSDLSKHPELEDHMGRILFLTARTPDQVRKWIEGFN